MELARVAGLLASTLGEQGMYRGKESKHYKIEIKIPCINLILKLFLCVSCKHMGRIAPLLHNFGIASVFSILSRLNSPATLCPEKNPGVH
jgi:hypothetical protein